MTGWLLLLAYAILVMVVITFGISKLSRSFLKRFPEVDPVGFMAGFVLTSFSLIPAIYFAKRTESLLALSILFFAVWTLLCLQFKASSKTKEIYTILICLIAGFFIPPQSAFIENFTYGYPILGIALYFMMRLFVLFDRIPNFSVITIITQAFLGFFLIRQGILPQELLYPAFYMIVAIISTAQTTKALNGNAVLGPYAATVVGFEAGFVWLCIMGQGFVLAPLVLYSFDLFQLLIAGIITLWTTHRIYPLTTPFLIEKAIATQTKEKKLYRFVFLISLLVALSAFLVIGNEIDYKNLCLVIALLMLSVYFTLNRWAQAQPTWRELGSDIKQSFLDVKHEINSLPLKKNAKKGKK